MQTLELLMSNPLINICLISWFSAQFIKTILYWIVNKKLNLGRFIGSGGMPSSHSALVISLAIAVARIEGFSSTEFALSWILASVVMYDAMGVRRAAGEHAKVLNKMIFDFEHIFEFIKLPMMLEFEEKEDDAQDPDETSEERMLKEFLGHTPMEVLGGCLLGILVAIIYPI